MKTIIRNSSISFVKFIFLITSLTSFSLNLASQDLTVSQTLDYLNKKFKEFPNRWINYVYYYYFSLTPTGELRIEKNEILENVVDQGNNVLTEKTIFRILINKIDLKESFKPNNSPFSDNNIHIYPLLNGSFYEETYDRKGILREKKTVASGTSDDRYGIALPTSDAGNIQNIKNALSHLCYLVLSKPTEYGLNNEIDPFEKVNVSNESGVILKNASNTIKIIKTQSGLIEIPIVINDVLRINFIFDSGASEVSLSPDVALTLLRTGTISESDWLPSQTYTFADGSKAKSKRFLIKKLIIGNQILTNIEASISNSIEAPMLIGQNVMQKLGSVTIDYDNLLLIIKTK
jgi:predicted aspartyl protease